MGAELQRSRAHRMQSGLDLCDGRARLASNRAQYQQRSNPRRTLRLLHSWLLAPTMELGSHAEARCAANRQSASQVYAWLWSQPHKRSAVTLFDRAVSPTSRHFLGFCEPRGTSARQDHMNNMS